MRDPERIDSVLKSFGELWKKVPDWRFGQLVCNLQRLKGDDLFYVEDDKFVEFCVEIKKVWENEVD